MTHYFNNEPEGQRDRGTDRAESWDPSDLKTRSWNRAGKRNSYWWAHFFPWFDLSKDAASTCQYLSFQGLGLPIYWLTNLFWKKLSGVTISFQMGMLRHENWNGGLWLVHSPKTVVISSMVASNSNKYATYMSMGSTYLMEQLFWRLDQSETSISLFMIQHAIYHTDMQLMHKFRALLWPVRCWVLQKQSQLLRLLLLLSCFLVWI